MSVRKIAGYAGTEFRGYTVAGKFVKKISGGSFVGETVLLVVKEVILACCPKVRPSNNPGKYLYLMIF